MDRTSLQETLGPVSVADPAKVPSSPAPVEQDSSLPRLIFPANMTPNVIVVRSEGCRNSAFACIQLLDFATEAARHIPGNRPVLGFDCEWVPSLRGRGKVALVQMSCLDGYTVIFRLKVRGGREAGVFPTALKELMENEEVDLVRAFSIYTPCKTYGSNAVVFKVCNCRTQLFIASIPPSRCYLFIFALLIRYPACALPQAGVGVTADIGRIKADYGVNGTGAVDIGVLAGKHLGVSVGERSLAALVASLLFRLLMKGSVRMSDWEQEALSLEQVIACVVV